MSKYYQERTHKQANRVSIWFLEIRKRNCKMHWTIIFHCDNEALLGITAKIICHYFRFFRLVFLGVHFLLCFMFVVMVLLQYQSPSLSRIREIAIYSLFTSTSPLSLFFSPILTRHDKIYIFKESIMCLWSLSLLFRFIARFSLTFITTIISDKPYKLCQVKVIEL